MVQCSCAVLARWPLLWVFLNGNKNAKKKDFLDDFSSTNGRQSTPQMNKTLGKSALCFYNVVGKFSVCYISYFFFFWCWCYDVFLKENIIASTPKEKFRKVYSILWREKLFNIKYYIISKSDILEINSSSIAPLDKCISQDTEPRQGAYDKI